MEHLDVLVWISSDDQTEGLGEERLDRCPRASQYFPLDQGLILHLELRPFESAAQVPGKSQNYYNFFYISGFQVHCKV